MSLSPKKLKFKNRQEPTSVMDLASFNSSKRNKFNIKEVVYSDVADSYRQPTKSVMQILKETNEDKVLKDEIKLFDNFEFPNDMRLTSNLLEMHPQIIKDKLRINKFIHKYFNPTLY